MDIRTNQALTNWNNETTLQAVTLFRAALAIDPDYALAKAELTRTLCWRAANLWSDNPAGDITESYQLGEQALQAAPNDPLVLFGVGACYGTTGRADESIRLLKKAIGKQPNFAMALAMLGLSYSLDEQPEQGLPFLERSLELAPQSPYLWLYETWRSLPLLELSRYEEAEQILQNGLESSDSWWWSWMSLAAARSGRGDIAGAQEALYTAREKEPLFSLSFAQGGVAVLYKNKGKNLLALLEPIWPEDLKTADHDASK